MGDVEDNTLILDEKKFSADDVVFEVIKDVEIEKSTLTFYQLKKSNGNTHHHFQIGLYTYSRRRIKKIGLAYFYCDEDECKSSVKAKYTDPEEEPTNLEFLNANHSHLPNTVKCLIIGHVT